MALSFLSLPPEVRVQIYRYLLCHASWVAPQRSMNGWPCNIQARAMSPLTSFEPVYSVESTILRTCRMIYSEAVPILYGENRLLYICCTPSLNQTDYPKAGFPDKNLIYIRHLELELLGERIVGIYAERIATTILYFARGGCDLRTFKLTLYEWGDPADGEEYQRHLINTICASSDLAASLVALQVSESLTISIWFGTYARRHDDGFRMGTRDECQGFVNRLALEKGMTATMEVDLPEMSEEEDDDDDDDDDFEVPYDCETCKMSWCLRPQRPQPQSSTMLSLID